MDREEKEFLNWNKNEGTLQALEDAANNDGGSMESDDEDDEVRVVDDDAYSKVQG